MKRWAECLVGAAVAVLLAVPAIAQAPALAPVAALESPVRTPTEAAPARDLALEAFVDGMVQSAMKSERIAGVGVTVVRDGRVVLLKGYGQSTAAGRPVDAEHTLFRIASISKTFTWIALMQLVESGRVDLEAPANTYLPPALQIPADGFAQPVLVRHLMTHTAGFEDLVAGHLFIANPETALPLVDALVRHRPRRVRAPGIASVYSNYGTALAGALVQNVSGMAFEDYVEQRILTPLGLQNTTFREPYSPALVQAKGLPSPMTPALAADVSDGFRWTDGAYAKQAFEHCVQFAPAGAASTTPADMGRYLIALMSGGAGVLKPETVALFARDKPFFTNAPGLNGLAFGMLQSHSENGWRAWGHGGDTLRFHSELAIYPDLGLGVFVTTNSVSGGDLRDILPGAIADRLGGRNPAFVAPPRANAAARPLLRKFAGAYLVDRRAYSNAERAFCLVNCIISVTVSDNGRLVVTSGGQTVRLAAMDHIDRGGGVRIHRFRNLDTGETAAFEERGGRVVRYLSAGGVNRAQRVSMFAAPDGFFAVTLIGLIAAFAALFSGLSRVFSPPQTAASARLAGLLLPLAGAGWLATLAAYGAYFQRAAGDSWVVFADWPGTMRLGAYGSIAAAILTVLAVVAVALAWLKADWSVWRRTRIVATLLAMIALAAMLNAWNLVGLRF